jgi:hypothetical protein
MAIVPVLPFPTVPPFPAPFPALPGFGGITPSGAGYGFTLPGLGLNQPGVPNPQTLVAQSFNMFNAAAAQLVSQPLSGFAFPFTIPSMVAQQYAGKVQAGAFQPRTAYINTAPSGVWTQVQPVTTLVLEGQLYNPNISGVAVATAAPGTGTPDANTYIPVAAGGTFNFGPIDLSTLYIANVSNNLAVPIKIYMEQ